MLARAWAASCMPGQALSRTGPEPAGVVALAADRLLHESLARPDNFGLRAPQSPSLPSAPGLAGHGCDAPDPRAILNSIGEVVYDWDLASDHLRWGANVCEVLGLSQAIASGLAFAELLAPESPATRFEAVMAAAKLDQGAGAPFQAQYGLVLAGDTARAAGRDRIWIEDSGRVFAGPDLRPLRAHGIIRVITQRFEAERQLAFASVFDTLTGALNRTNLAEHISRMFAQCARTQGSFAVLLVGIRQLTRINRVYGYDVADELIAGLAARLRLNLRATDKIGRYAGNKFALVLDACDAEQMMLAAARFQEIVDAEPIATSVGPLPVSILTGAILAPRHARQTQTVLQHAEEALDMARGHADRRIVAYEPSLARDDARMRALKIADEVVSALNERRITLAYQPIVDAKTGSPVYQEALMRLRHGDGSLIAPCHVLPLAEKAGLIGLIDHRVLELALARLGAQPHLRLALNVSGATMHDAEWPARLKAALAMNPGTANRLVVEITETEAIADIDATRMAIAAMKALGLKVAMDDFGSGHTSFRNLRMLGIDILKIDGAFMQNLARSPDDRFFVRTLVDLARHLGIPTVAEWVEDAETARILAEWGVDYLQGHFFGKAEVPGEEEVVKAA